MLSDGQADRQAGRQAGAGAVDPDESTVDASLACLCVPTGRECDAVGCVVNEYGDSSDPMGSAGPVSFEKSFTCFSAPQAYKAGWSSPIANLNKDTVTAGSGWVSVS